MTYKKQIAIGSIFRTPEIHGLEIMLYLISYEPSETIPKTGKIFLHKLLRKRPDGFPWQVQYGQYIIDCFLNPLLLTEKELTEFEYEDCLPDDKIDKLMDAHHFAEKQKLFGNF